MDKKKITAIILFVIMGLVMFSFANPSDPIEESKDNKEQKETKKDQTNNEEETNNEENTEQVNRNDYNNQNNEIVVDNAPIITINPSIVKIVEGTNYDVLSGVTATDDLDTVALKDITYNTSELAVGEYVINYETTADRKNQIGKNSRTIKVLSKTDDEDNDGYTNGEESSAGTNFDDENSKPNYGSAPVINISEDNIYSMEVKTTIPTFVASADDTADGEVEVTITHNINANKLGTYKVRFVAIDSLGNKAELEKDFEVVDTNAPVITNVIDGNYYNVDVTPVVTDDTELTLTLNGNDYILGTAITDNGVYTLVATDEAGNVATVTIIIDKEKPVITLNGDEVVNLLKDENATYTDEGATASDNLDGDITDSIISNSNVDITAIGSYTVTYNVTDKAGNVADEVTRTVNVLDPDSDDDNDGYTNKEELDNDSDPLDVEVKPTDNAPVITVNPTEVTIYAGDNYDLTTGVSVEDDFDTLTATSDITDTTVLGLGSHTVTYSAKDRTNDTITATRTVKVIRTVEDTNVLATIEYVPNVWTNVNVVAAISFSEDGVTITNNDGNDTYEFNDNGTFTFEFIDKYGSVGSATAEVSTIDRTAPSVTGVENNKTYSESVTPIVSDTNLDTVELNNNAYVSGTPITVTGSYTLVATDKAGNTTTIQFNIDIPTPDLVIGDSNKVKESINENLEISIGSNDGNNERIIEIKSKQGAVITAATINDQSFDIKNGKVSLDKRKYEKDTLYTIEIEYNVKHGSSNKVAYTIMFTN